MARFLSRTTLFSAQTPQLAAQSQTLPQCLARGAPVRPRWRRFNGTSSSTEKPANAQSRVERILSKLPPSMQKYTRRLKNAPVSHVVAFLILHEITAVVPLLGLFGLFHYTDYVPIDYMMGHYGGYVGDGARRFERYFKRKGWFGFGEDDDGGPVLPKSQEGGENTRQAVLDKWSSSDKKYKIVVEVALAYAITKVLLPVRIVGSLWATPWFAGVLGKLRRLSGLKTTKR